MTNGVRRRAITPGGPPPVNRQLRDTIDALDEHVALLARDGTIVAVNQAWLSFAEDNRYPGTGAGVGTNYCETCDRVVGPDADQAALVARGIRHVLAGDVVRMSLDYPCRSPTMDRWFQVTVRGIASPGTVKAIVTHTDRTAEWLAERALAAALDEAERDRQRLLATMEALPVGVWIADASGRLTHTNRAAATQWGGATPGASCVQEYIAYEGFWPATQTRIAPDEWALARTLRTGETVAGELVEVARFDGQRGRALISSAPILDRDSRMTGGVGIMVDVTDRVLAEEAIRSSERQLREQFAKLPVPTMLWEARDGELLLVDANEAACETFPRLDRAPAGRRYAELFPGDEGVSPDLWHALESQTVVRRTVSRHAGPILGERLFELTMGPQAPNRVLAHAIDITERTTLEAQLRQAQKMEAVGQLAGGVAHDFNNLLTIIGAHSAFLLEALEPGDPRHEDASAIREAGVRAAALTRQLLAFSRKQILKPAPLDLNERVVETRKLLDRLLGEDILIATVLADDLGVIVADATQIDQVLLNLAVNARDAMPAGGTLTITTGNVTVADDAPRSQRVVPPGAYTVLEVSDTGVGMDATVLARLFEPFFTTKSAGHGTGLGLATVYGIVKQSGGYVVVDSVVDQGTTFRVFLPRITDDAHPEALRVAVATAVRGVETVLLVEDDAAVREIGRRLLTRLGYIVLVAPDGAAALALSAAFVAPIDLVISDAVMPGMTGAETVRRLQAQRPGLPALFTSGYTDDEILRRGIVTSTAAFVQKPFELQTFAHAVRDALDGRVAVEG
jgi:signal transduction histidine kinase/ActR/RegA family two-component response regulator